MSGVVMVKVIAYVAPSSTGFGIRLRASRGSQGVWMAEGWPEHAPEGATASKEGYRWQSAEEAEQFLTRFILENAEHGYTNANPIENGVAGWQ